MMGRRRSRSHWNQRECRIISVVVQQLRWVSVGFRRSRWVRRANSSTEDIPHRDVAPTSSYTRVACRGISFIYSLPPLARVQKGVTCALCIWIIISCVKLLALKIVNMGSNGFSVPLFSMPCIYPLLYLFVLLLLLCSVVVIVVLHRKRQAAYLPVWRLDRPYPQQNVSSV